MVRWILQLISMVAQEISVRSLATTTTVSQQENGEIAQNVEISDSA
jgi:hypothetical protein